MACSKGLHTPSLKTSVKIELGRRFTHLWQTKVRVCRNLPSLGFIAALFHHCVRLRRLQQATVEDQEAPTDKRNAARPKATRGPPARLPPRMLGTPSRSSLKTARSLRRERRRAAMKR